MLVCVADCTAVREGEAGAISQSSFPSFSFSVLPVSGRTLQSPWMGGCWPWARHRSWARSAVAVCVCVSPGL